MIHLLRGYNSRHPRTLDASLPYLQFAFNRAIHSSTLKSHFEVCLGYLLSSPFDMTFSLDDKQKGKEEEDRLKAQRLLESVSKVHKEVEEQLQKSQQRYRARHDKHRLQHDFNESDMVWLKLSKERPHGAGKKLKPIRYGPFKILEKIGDNAFRLELPLYMQMYSVTNVEYLNPLADGLRGKGGQLTSRTSVNVYG
ncbi:hypothetical protein ACFX11_023101 [Malus domestica]